MGRCRCATSSPSGRLPHRDAGSRSDRPRDCRLRPCRTRRAAGFNAFRAARRRGRCSRGCWRASQPGSSPTSRSPRSISATSWHCSNGSRLRRGAGRGVVLVLHDLPLAMNHADRVLVLDKGRLAADGPPPEALSAETDRLHLGRHRALARRAGRAGARSQFLFPEKAGATRRFRPLPFSPRASSIGSIPGVVAGIVAVHHRIVLGVALAEEARANMVAIGAGRAAVGSRPSPTRHARASRSRCRSSTRPNSRWTRYAGSRASGSAAGSGCVLSAILPSACLLERLGIDLQSPSGSDRATACRAARLRAVRRRRGSG